MTYHQCVCVCVCVCLGFCVCVLISIILFLRPIWCPPVFGCLRCIRSNPPVSTCIHFKGLSGFAPALPLGSHGTTMAVPGGSAAAFFPSSSPANVPSSSSSFFGRDFRPIYSNVRESRPFDSSYDPMYCTSTLSAFQHDKRVRVRATTKIKSTTKALVAAQISSFHQRPRVPYMAPMIVMENEHKAHTDAATATAAAAAAATDAAEYEKTKHEIKHKSVEIQSMYRETETQTMPYSPDFIVAPNETPEIVHLERRKFHQTPNMEDIEFVIKMREMKKFEQNVPPMTDENAVEKRRRMLEEREHEQWRQREQEMREEQEMKLKAMVEALKKRQQINDQFDQTRLQKLNEQKEMEHDLLKQNIQETQLKRNRAIESVRRQQMSEKKQQKRDVVHEYADAASRVHAPIEREGKVPVRNQVVDYGIPMLQNYQGLSDLEKTATASQGQIVPQRPVMKTLTRKEKHIQQQLHHVSELLYVKKAKAKHVDNVYKKFEPIVRAKTPEVQPRTDDEKLKGLLFLQRLLRGRSSQNLTFERKEHNLPLIRELRLSEEHPKASDGSEQLIQSETPLPLATAFSEPIEPDELESIAVDALQGEIISNTLDFISKELVRLVEEEKIILLKKQADFQRRFREQEEAGRRQAEQLVAEAQNNVYEQIVDQHHRTATNCVSIILKNAAENYADATSHELAVIHSEVIVPMLNAIEAENDTPESLVANLLSNFVLPEVKRMSDQQSVRFEQVGVAHAAHALLVNTSI